MNAQPDHWTERGRAASVFNSNATGRPRRSVLAFGEYMSKRLHSQKQAIADYLVTNRVEFRELSEAELADACDQWLRKFASRVKSQEDTWVYRGFRWHGFSYGIEPSLSGEAALRAYRNTKGRFYVFDEDGSYGYICKTGSLFRLELSHLHADIYVTSTSFTWTMAFTHEEPHIGPFFAEQTGCTERRDRVSVGNRTSWTRRR